MAYEKAKAAAALVKLEAMRLQSIAANNQAGSSAAALRMAYLQARSQVDFAHIEADIDLTRTNPLKRVMGGHFPSSPITQIVPGTKLVGQNGSIKASVLLQAPNGTWHPKSNGFASMTPETWSLARAKGEMSQAFLNKFQNANGRWEGRSSGVEFTFFEPNNTTVHLWRGYPRYTP